LHDRSRFKQPGLAIFEHWHAPQGMTRQVFGGPHAAIAELKSLQFKGKAKLFQQPENTHGAGVRSEVEFHAYIRFNTMTCAAFLDPEASAISMLSSTPWASQSTSQGADEPQSAIAEANATRHKDARDFE
jgi:hypothetical protein